MPRPHYIYRPPIRSTRAPILYLYQAPTNNEHIMSSGRSYPKRTRHSAAAAGGTIGTGGTSYAQRRGGRPRRSTGDIANNNTNDAIGDDNENDYDFDFDGTEDGAAGVMGSGSGGSSYPSYGNLPKRRKINALHSGGSGNITANQRWVKVYRRPMAPTDEPYFGSSPFASFTLPTWVKVQDLTMDERAAYDKLEEEKMKKKKTTAKLAQDAGMRESSSDDAVVVVVPSAPVVEAGAGEAAAAPIDEEGDGDKQQYETTSSTDIDPSISAASTNPSAVATVDEGTNTPLMMMNLEEEVKVEDTAIGVAEVPMETSLSKMGEEVNNNNMKAVNDYTNHGGGNEIDGSIDQGRVDDDPSGVHDAEEEAEGDEDEEEKDQEEEDDDDNEEGDDDLDQNS